jgi:hypothetical protein
LNIKKGCPKLLSIPIIVKAKELFGRLIISTSNRKPARQDEGFNNG